MKTALLVQLPVPDFRWPSMDANVPLAAGYLASWARTHAADWRVDILPWQEVDTLGDQALYEVIARRNPDLVGFSLYLWNAERSVHLARRLGEIGTQVVFGGPEVSDDNPWLWKAVERGAGIAGEGEEAFAEVLRSLDLPPFGWGSSPVDLSRVESPYLTGLLGPHPDGSVWIETLRGCPFRCSYCRYGKTHGSPRRFRADWLQDHLRWAVRAGAREVYLMDPSFNVRSDWEPVLQTLESANSDGSLAYHTEIVADALRPGDAERLARAGLRSCEVGLQSMHADVLAAVGRPWDRSRWLSGVRDLQGAGVSVVVGLIAGLPGDSLARFTETLDFVLTQVPGAELQVFPLALLPGTELRARARDLGLLALERPPYTVTRTPGYEADDFAAVFDRFEQATGLELDPVPFPRLAGSWEGGEGAPYVSGVKIDAMRAPPAWVEQISRRAARDLTVWVRGWSETLPAQLGALDTALPHGVLTVVLEDRAGWPPERMERLLAAGGRNSYLARHLRHLYGEGAQVTPRLVVLVEDGDPKATDRWVTRIRTRADLTWILEASPGWSERATALVREGETVHVRGSVTVADLPALARTLEADSVGVGFSSGKTQERWERITGANGFRAPEYRVSIP